MELKLSLFIDHQNIHFIGCTHWGHKSIIKFDKRPYSSIEEHDEALIQNWNKKVKKNDVVFHLGDISFKSPKQVNPILEQLNGTINLVAGNHDRLKDIKKLTKIKECFGLLNLYVKDDKADDKDGKQQHINLCHYPLLSWSRSMYNSWMIHSHTHQHLTNDPMYDWFYKRKVIDVGVNGINYEPISYADVKEIMVSRKIDLLNLE